MFENQMTLMRFKTVVFLAFFHFGLFAQTQVAPGMDDLNRINNHMETVSWMQVYDIVAWLTADSLVKHHAHLLDSIGQDWFCYEADDKWHAVYGTFHFGTFNVLLHFSENIFGEFQPTDPLEVNPQELESYARALQTARQYSREQWLEVPFHYNQYIRKNSDHTFSVWLLPAFFNRQAFWGFESIFTISACGREVLASKCVTNRDWLAFPLDQPDEEVWIDESMFDELGLGAIYFLWNFKNYFRSMHLETSKIRSTIVLVNGQWQWVHSTKDEAVASPSKSKRNSP
jgi:hypothetical protein